MRDYRKSPPAIQHKKINFNLFFVIFLVLLVFFLLCLAVKTELNKFYKLKSNERVLLTKNQQPVAILFFNVADKQLVVTDLRSTNFDLTKLATEASLSGKLQKNLIYTFLLGMTFDNNYEYVTSGLEREDLLAFFRHQSKYYLFLKDRDTLWREQQFEQDKISPALTFKPVFACPVALINTTKESGLANMMATVLEKSAFSIIKKDSNQDNLGQSKIFYDESVKECGQLLAQLQKVLPDSVLINDREKAIEQRAALAIYIGRDLADLYLVFVNLFQGQI